MFVVVRDVAFGDVLDPALVAFELNHRSLPLLENLV
jgi:hypothetical protein